MERIANQANVSVDAVKSWKKWLNLPGSLECVEVAAKVLGATPFRLLKSIPEAGEIMADPRDLQLLREVFAKLVEVHYQINRIELFPDDQRLNTIHFLIEQHLLDVSEETLAQFGLIYDRWENICDEIPKRIATEKFVGILKKVFQITFPSIIL